MDQLALLGILADGRFHSGDELGRMLGVSRAAISKAVRGFDALGLEVHSVRGKGHRLSSPLELLDQTLILSALDEAVRPRLASLELLASVDSTNSQLMRGLQQRRLNLADGRLHACLAERQTGGRGRRGRAWISPFGCNMYLSVVREFAAGATALEGLSLAVAVALVRALSKCGTTELGVKWPNDVLWRGRKLAGILLEMSGDVTGECQVIVGIGLNVQLPAAAMDEVSQPWVDLRSISPAPPGRNRVIGGVLNELLAMLREFDGRGFAAFRREWERLDAFRDAPVELRSDPSRPGVSGLARGVTAQGALRLETARGIETFNAGEVSLRGHPRGVAGASPRSGPIYKV